MRLPLLGRPTDAEIPTLSLLRALNSSIGKKYVMALTGLLLCGFLVVHLAGNVLMYVGIEAYEGYVEALHRQEWFVVIAETGLLVLFLAHIALAVSTWRDNSSARRVSYARRESKLVSRAFGAAESWMFVSGAVVLLFLIWHVLDFTFEAREVVVPLAGGFAYDEVGPFAKAVALLQNPISATVYVIGCIFLLFHLAHGFASAFQTLGINHPTWNGLIKWFGLAFAFVTGLGFASFVVWAAMQPDPLENPEAYPSVKSHAGADAEHE